LGSIVENDIPFPGGRRDVSRPPTSLAEHDYPAGDGDDVAPAYPFRRGTWPTVIVVRRFLLAELPKIQGEPLPSMIRGGLVVIS
jgi:hypothetical protein